MGEGVGWDTVSGHWATSPPPGIWSTEMRSTAALLDREGAATMVSRRPHSQRDRTARAAAILQ
jgi:hypothetical protein